MQTLLDQAFQFYYLKRAYIATMIVSKLLYLAPDKLSGTPILPMLFTAIAPDVTLFLYSLNRLAQILVWAKGLIPILVPWEKKFNPVLTSLDLYFLRTM
jgi:hypothetical protein